MMFEIDEKVRITGYGNVSLNGKTGVVIADYCDGAYIVLLDELYEKNKAANINGAYLNRIEQGLI